MGQAAGSGALGRAMRASFSLVREGRAARAGSSLLQRDSRALRSRSTDVCQRSRDLRAFGLTRTRSSRDLFVFADVVPAEVDHLAMRHTPEDGAGVDETADAR